MKKLSYISVLVCLFLNINHGLSQNFLNGNFETNTAVTDQINLSNAAFNAFMPDCNGFGTTENLDIVTSNTYGGGPQNGSWYVALTGGGTDLLSLKLSAPLIPGNTYTGSFFDKAWSSFVALPIEIGLSTTNNNFGTLVYTTPSSAVNSIWTQRTFTFSAPNNGQYVTVRQQGVLQNWVQVDNFSFNNIQAPPTVSLSNDTAVCEGSCATVSATVSGGTPPYNYSWLPAIGSGAGPFSVCPVSTTTYSVMVTDASGLTATGSVTVTVNSPPTASLSPSGTINVCNAGGITLNANAGDYHYVWYHNGVIVQTGTASSYFANLPGVYEVQVSDNISGCSSMSPSATLVLGGGPVANIVTAGGCGGVLFNGGSVPLTATASNAVSYLWSPGGQTTASIQVTQPGTYCVTAYDASGCPSDVPACTTINNANVECGHNGQKVILCHVPPGNPGNPQTLCIAPSAVSAHLANHPGDCLGPCSWYYPRLSSSAYDNDETSSFAVIAYPNPFSATFSLELFNPSEEQMDLTIYDVTGRAVETYNDVNEKTIVGNDFPKGIYFVEARQGDSIRRIRIMKQ